MISKFSIAAITRRFHSDRRGAVAIMFGLSIIAMIVAAGAAVDFGRTFAEKSRLQAAIDASALAAARLADASESERQHLASRFFAANYSAANLVTLSTGLSEDGTAISVTASRAVPLYLLGVIGRDSLNITAASLVPLAKRGKAEIVLVLDYSDSMNDSDKYIRMHNAAVRLIDKVSDNGNNPNIKIGLVPFSAVVKVDIPPVHIRSDVTYAGCTVDRRHPYNTSESTADAGDDSKWGDASAGGHPCTDAGIANLTAMPLTADLAAAKSRLASYTPYLWTHIALGAEIGWQFISPEGFTGQPAPYSDTSVLKVVVLLTDGMQTAHSWGPGGTRTAENGEQNLLDTCRGMKDKKIQVFTIGYDLDSAHTHDLLQQCANSGNYYSADAVEGALISTFESIGKRVEELALRLAK